MTNPYRVGSWVIGNEFYSRGGLVKDILAGSADSLWIIGNRRIGKTSLLRAAEHQAANNPHHLALFWDMQGDTTEGQLIESLIESLENAQWNELDKRWQDFDLPEDATSIGKALRQVAAHTRQHQCRLLLLCDEIEGLNQIGQQEPHILSGLRRVMQHNPVIRTVLASTRRLSRLYAIQAQDDTSLFLEGLEPRYLAHFDDHTANQVICRSQSDAPLSVDKTFLGQIRHFSGNHPLILQKVCSQLFDPQTNTLRPFAENEFILDDQLAGTFQQDFDSLTSDEANLLCTIGSQSKPRSALSQLFPGISESSLRRMLHDLTQLGFVRRVEGRYQASSVPLTRWLDTDPPHYAQQGGVTNRMMREVAQERVTTLQRELVVRYRRLGHLKTQQARQGANTLPEILMEIEDYEAKIEELEAELEELGENIDPHSSQF